MECIRKTVKWYKKLFFHLTDITLLNAYNMYIENTGKKSSLRLFSRNVVTQLLQKYGTLTSLRPGKQSTGQIDRLSAVTFSERHYISFLPLDAKGHKKQRHCHVCWNTTTRPQKKRKVTTWCPGCNIALCIDNCYKQYHKML